MCIAVLKYGLSVFLEGSVSEGGRRFDEAV